MNEYEQWHEENMGSKAPVAHKEDAERIVFGYYSSLADAIVGELTQRLGTPRLHSQAKMRYQKQLEQFSVLRNLPAFGANEILLLDRAAAKFLRT